MKVFKTKAFATAARKAEIPDGELCEAIQEVMKGQGSDLGGRRMEKAFERKSSPVDHSR